MSDQLTTISGNTIEIPSMSIVINMTALDEIDAWASPFKEIILNVDGKMHRYKTEEVLKILKEIELD